MHTKGPWKVSSSTMVVTEDGKIVSNLLQLSALNELMPSLDEVMANAHLIAAAPEMKRHFQLLLELSERNDYETYRNAVKEIAANAIRLAEGKG